MLCNNFAEDFNSCIMKSNILNDLLHDFTERDGVVSVAILMLLTVDDTSAKKLCSNVKNDLFRLRLCLTTD